MDLVWYTALFGVLSLGFLLTLLTWPGNWMMIGATCVYAWLTGWRFLGWRTVLLLVGIGLVGEIVSVITCGVDARRVGQMGWGKFVGMVVKIVVACVIFLIGVFGGFPNRRGW